MNIKILDSWIREFVKTSATPQTIAEKLSLTSVGIEHIEKIKNDYLYDIEVTTNRPELMSVQGIAREAATVLPQSNIVATFKEPLYTKPKITISRAPEFTIKNNSKLIRRICAVIMEVKIKDTPQVIKDRLESSGIRSLNNIIDVTNYIMRELGHPTHVFDYDRLLKHTLIVRESKKGEKMTTLDGKTFTLSGGDIIADDGTGEIVDLMGVMGTANSVVTNSTKRIVFFIDNVEPNHIRKTSMEYGIRTEAAIINEKGINPEQSMNALIAGIHFFEKIADAKIISQIIDIYPEPLQENKIFLPEQKLHALVGIEIPRKTTVEILTKLGFVVKEITNGFEVTIPKHKTGVDMQIAEDLIEEIARIYGYHNIPNTLPAITQTQPFHLGDDSYYWEDHVKDTLKNWGFTEVYTYPMVSQVLLQNDAETAVTIHNPLSDELVYMRQSLLPSLLKVVDENQDHDVIKLFEIGNIYLPQKKKLPLQTLRLSGVIAKQHVSFYEVKGIIEQLFEDIGLKKLIWKHREEGYGALVAIEKTTIGFIDIISSKRVTFELDFDAILAHATLKKVYKPVSLYPPIIEDLAIIAPAEVTIGEIIETIQKQSPLISHVSLLDKYQETRTFHIVYQSFKNNLTDKEVGEIREKILKTLHTKYNAKLKSI